MFYKAQNGLAEFDGGKIDYIKFGTGKRNAIILPGVGDGLRTVKGLAIPFAILYRRFAKDFTVYAFSRRRDISSGTTARQMADDLAKALDSLGLDKVDVVGVSQGGMIVQWLAIDHPEKVNKLVLAVTVSRPNDTLCDVLTRWIGMAEKEDYKSIMKDTARRAYSEKWLKSGKDHLMLGNFGRPKSFGRFITLAASGLTHDSYDELHRITAPTLVIGGKLDKIVTGRASEEIASQIPDCRLYMYEELGHGLYEEAPDFLDRVAEFFLADDSNRN
ncbi:MAG: alpha/beta hydrolase [Lachnospiraceae bacterium]|nr:alpha/beta hydrolase [Lachnospiraceae bacterium]